MRLRDDKRPRPIVLRANEGDNLVIEFQNLLDPVPAARIDPTTGIELDDQPFTRTAGITVFGLQAVDAISDIGANVGRNASALAAPGETKTYKLFAEKEGAYHMESTAGTLGGEGGHGSLAFGLFGQVNVEPAGATWYRSQVTRAELQMALNKDYREECDDGNGAYYYSEYGYTCGGHPIIDYEATYPAGHRFASLPILKILNGSEIVHSDTSAIIVQSPANVPRSNPAYPNRHQPFREFGIVFHDEIKAIQAFQIFRDNEFQFTLSSVKDGFAINYGSGGVGAEIVANRLGVGPMWDCVDCKYEEFFLTSWAVGDPAMIVDIPANAGTIVPTAAGPVLETTPGPKANFAFYPDDPANVFHSYLSDHVKIRNTHVGSEHHIFHLHAHQWLFTPNDDNSNYLDAQAIGPGSAYTYEIAYNGSGNRIKTSGDAIFHCHFYPHFAQGMWALWRVHDVFEMGTQLASDAGLPLGHGKPAPGARALPDGEILAGTPIPAVVPMPGLPMAPLPGAKVEIIAGQAEITPLEDKNGDGYMTDDDLGNPGFPFFIPGIAGHRPPTAPLDLEHDGGLPRHVITGGTAQSKETPLDFSKDLLTAQALYVPEDGTAVEKAAMDFHATHFHPTVTPEGDYGLFETNGMPPVPGAPFAEPCRPDSFGDYASPIGNPRTYRAAVIELEVILNKVGWHFNQQRIIALEQDVNDTLAGIRPPEPFVMRANTNDCVDFYHTNLVPNVYQQDDFQVKTPTDVIGQHIHLVKFDVMTADGAANGWNYEDGTFSPDEVVERIEAIRAGNGCDDGAHSEACPEAEPGFNGVLGARTTIQRWFIDPLENNQGIDRGLGNVFTHDHFGPSTHQQAGLYATLLVEPEGSSWRDPETGIAMGSRADGGPTSWRADILAGADSYREFYLEFADFQLAYTADGQPINPPVKNEVGLPDIVVPANICPNGSPAPCPEAVSANDPGTHVVNYRNEPVPLRVSTPGWPKNQAAGLAGDLSYVFSSLITRADPALNTQPGWYAPLTADVQPRDPYTPLLRVYDGDDVRIRIQVGAHEEGHVANVHGVKWTQEYFSPNTGWRNAQMAGISEQFQFRAPVKTGGTRSGSRADHLYTVNASTDGYWNGAWGMMRSYPGLRSDLQPLPNNPIATGGLVINNTRDFRGMCPRTAPVRSYDVTAVTAEDALPDVAGLTGTAGIPGGTLVYNSRTAAGFGPLHDPTAILFVRTEDLDAGGKLLPNAPIEPLILRAAAGECIDVTLRSNLPNDMPELDGFNNTPMIITNGAGPGAQHFTANDLAPSNSVGLHPQLVAFDVTNADGANVGMNSRTQTARQGDRRPQRYLWYAGDVSYDKTTGNLIATPIEFGATNLFSSDPIKHSNKGAVGALIIEPEGSDWVETDTDHVTGRLTRAQATVTDSSGATLFREMVVVHQDDVNLRYNGNQAVPNVAEVEDAGDSGQRGLNYRSEPMWFRFGFEPTIDEDITREIDYTNAVSNVLVGGDPETPVFKARAGTPTRFRVVQPGGHYRNTVVSLQGHLWQREPYIDTTAGDQLGSTAIGENPFSFWRNTQEGHGPGNHFDLVLRNGAGGKNTVPGDYLYRDHTSGHFNNGNWAIFRVEP